MVWRRLGSTRIAFGNRALGLVTLAGAGAAILYLLRPAAVTDDTFAFLDWGRDLRHGYLPLLEHRTFHPLPIAGGAVVSVFGAAAPTITAMLSLTALVLLAAASWRIVSLLGFGQPAPALAALFALASPLLAVLALAAFMNLVFAALLLWALVSELEGRRPAAWALLITAGLVRPEGWAFLLAYGMLALWRAGFPRTPRRWLPIVALSLGPIALWLGLEWSLFGDPLYSFHYTRPPFVEDTGSDSVRGFWSSLRFGLAVVQLGAAGVGAIAVATFAPRRLAATLLGMTLIALLTLVTLALSHFNVPARHFSVFVPLVGALAAIGAMTPARLLARTRAPGVAAAIVGAAGVALVVGFAAAPTIHSLRGDFRRIDAVHDTGQGLAHAVSGARSSLDVHSAGRHTVALLGAVQNAELVWALRVPFNVVTDRVEPQTRLIVEPSPAIWRRLKRLGLTDRTRSAPPPGWHRLARGDWEMYTRRRNTPIPLG